MSDSSSEDFLYVANFDDDYFEKRAADDNPFLLASERQMYTDQLYTVNAGLLTETYPYLAGSDAGQIALSEIGPTVSPYEAATLGPELFAQHELQLLADGWSQMPATEQRATWGQLTDLQQQALVNFGVSAPKDEDGSWLGDVFDFAESVAGTVLGGVGKAISIVPGGDKALSVLSFIGNAPFALYRGIRQLDSWQQWVAVGGAIAGVALAGVTGGLSLAATGTLMGTLATAGTVGLAATAGAAAAATAVSGTQYMAAVRDSWDGERAFLPSAQQEAFDLLQRDELFLLAKDVAYDLDPMTIAREFAGVRDSTDDMVLLQSVTRVAANYADEGTPEFEQISRGLYELYRNDIFREAVKVLQDGKISMGRDVARGLQLDPDSTLYRTVSGGVDAFSMFTLDPLLVASPLLKTARFAKYSPTGSTLHAPRFSRTGKAISMTSESLGQWRVNLRYKSSKVAAMDDQVAAAINTNNAALMPKNMRPIWDNVRSYWQQEGLLGADMLPVSGKTFTAEHLYEWMIKSDQMQHLARGVSTVPGLGFTAIRPMSDAAGWGRVRRVIRDFKENLIDETALARLEKIIEKTGVEDSVLLPPNELGTNMHPELVAVDTSLAKNASLAARFGGYTGRLLSIGNNRVGTSIGTFLDAITNMAPRRGYIALGGEAALDDVTTFVNAFGMTFNLPPQMRKQWINAIMGQEGVASRNIMLRYFYDSVFEASGFKNTRRGAEIYEEFIQKFDQHYTVGGIDNLELRSGLRNLDIRTGTLTRTSQAIDIAIPNVRELIRARRFEQALGDYGLVTNAGLWIDTFQNKIWKPSVILRIGFIPRAIGEEALAWVARGTSGRVGAEFSAKRLIQLEQREAVLAKLRSGSATLDTLSLADRQVLAGWRSPTDMRRLERIISRQMDANPITAMIMKYESWMRRTLEPQRYADGWQTSRRKRMADRIDQSNPVIQALLVGKQHSWRRMAIGGIDQGLKSATRDFMLQHADSVMRVASSGHNTIREDAITDPAGVGFIESTDAFVTTERLRDPHAREVYDIGDSEHYAHSLHEQANFVMDDPVLGPIIDEVYPLTIPDNFEISPTVFGGALQFWDLIPDPRTRQTILDVLSGRQDRIALDPAALEASGKSVDDALDWIADALGFAPNSTNPLITLLRETADDPALRAWVNMHLHREHIIQSFSAYIGEPGFEWLNPYVNNRADINGLMTGDWAQTNFVQRDGLELLLKERLRDVYLDPKIREQVDMSIRTLTSSGEAVANRIPSGQRRVYLPDVPDYAHIKTIIDQKVAAGITDVGQLLDEVTVELVSQPTITSVSDELYDFLVDNGYQIIRQAVGDLYIRNLHNAPWGPMPHIGFNDARVAQWVSDTLSGGVRRTPNVGQPTPTTVRTMHYVDVPRAQANKVGDIYEGLENTLVVGDRQVYRLDDVAAGRADALRGNPLDDGTFGVSVEDAVDRFFDDMIQTTFNVLGKNSRTRYTVLADDTLFVKAADGTMQPIAAGTQFAPTMQGQIYTMTPDNTFVVADLQNRTHFTPQHIPGGEPMWALTAPILMDRLDELAGTRRYVEKEITYKDPVTGRLKKRNEKLPAVYSRSSDVFLVGEGALPEQVVGPKFITKTENYWDRILKFGFDRVITPTIDRMLRHPLAMHEFVTARLQNIGFMEDFLGLPQIKSIIDEVDAQLLRQGGTGGKLGDILREHTMQGFRNSDRALAVAYYDAIKERLWDTALTNETTIVQMMRDELASYAFGPPTSGTLLDVVFETDAAMMITPELIQSYQAIDNWMNHVNETSSIAAIRNLEPFLDTAESKSMFSQYTKNLLPFWYAEENFIKRWLRSANTNGLLGIDLIRKGQLGYMGLRSAGVIQTDANGQDWVVLPGSAAMTEIMAKLIPGADSLPIGVMMATTPDSLLPGFSSQAGKPAVSPFGAIPIGFVAQMFPEARGLQRAIVGDIAMDRSIVDQLMPTSARRFWEAITADENSSTRYASAMRTAMAMMEARGEGLPSNATAEQMQDYVDKIREHARIVMWSMAAFGFISPGAPTPIVTGEDFGSFSWLTGMGIDNPSSLVNAQYKEYIDIFGYEEGVSQFLADNPWATLNDIIDPMALTVSQTATASGTSLPATEEALAWYDDNSQWAEENPFAAAWFVPQGGTDDFSRYAYQQQMNAELRKRLSPQDFLLQLKFKEAATVYFPQKQLFDDMKLAAANDPVQLSRIEEEEARWSDMFLAAHPWFKDQLTNPDSRNRRERTIRELRYAINDPTSPANPQIEGIRAMIGSYDSFKGTMANFGLRGRSAEVLAARRREQQNFLNWVEQWKALNPDLVTLYESVIKPDLGTLIG